MEAPHRYQLFSLAEKVEDKDISIMKELRIDHLADELGEITTESLQQVIAAVLACSMDNVQDKLRDHDSQLALMELAGSLQKKAS